jgi:HSP20 family protein
LVVGDTLDTDKITATYDAGVLSLRIPVAEKSKPRKISIGNGTSDHHAIRPESVDSDRQVINA